MTHKTALTAITAKKTWQGRSVHSDWSFSCFLLEINNIAIDPAKEMAKVVESGRFEYHGDKSNLVPPSPFLVPMLSQNYNQYVEQEIHHVSQNAGSQAS